MTITWGKAKKVKFDGVCPIKEWEPPFRAAIYAVMMPGKKEGYVKLIYVGESENLSERGFKSHHARSCWVEHAGGESNLFIGVHLMPNSSQEERRGIEQQLISDYNPVCNI